MKTKSITQAVIIGIVLGVLVIRPLSTLPHLFDPHADDVSWSGYLADVYGQIFSFNDVGPTLLSVLAGIVVTVFVVMIRARKNRGQSPE